MAQDVRKLACRLIQTSNRSPQVDFLVVLEVAGDIAECHISRGKREVELEGCAGGGPLPYRGSHGALEAVAVLDVLKGRAQQELNADVQLVERTWCL